MTYLRRSIGLACGLAVLCCLLACGAIQQAAKDALDAQKLGSLYTEYASANNQKGPADADAWAKWAEKNNKSADDVALINQAKAGGKYTFYWNVDMGKLPGPANSTVIGYENKVTAGPTGMVIMADGVKVEAMSPDQFKAAKKADGK